MGPEGIRIGAIENSEVLLKILRDGVNCWSAIRSNGKMLKIYWRKTETSHDWDSLFDFHTLGTTLFMNGMMMLFEPLSTCISE